MRFNLHCVLLGGMLCLPQTIWAQDLGNPSGGGEPAEGGNADDTVESNDMALDRPIPAQATGPGDVGPPVFTLDPHCTDMHACLKVRAVRGKSCHAEDSLVLQITNACKKPVALGVCIEQTDHTWTCDVQAKLGAGQVDKKSFNSCHSTGSFHVLASTANDQAKQPCFTNSRSPNASNLLPGPYLGVCARVKLCCRALQSLPGADALAQACDALDALPDNVGVDACAQILAVMRHETARMAGTPMVCH